MEKPQYHKDDHLLYCIHDEAVARYEESRLASLYEEWKRTLNNSSNKNQDDVQYQTKLRSAPTEPKRPRLNELPQTDLEPDVLVTTIERNKDKRKIILPPVISVTIFEMECRPPMSYWLEIPINYRVEDGEYLQNYPYLEEGNDVEFENKLYDLYGEKDFITAGKKVMPDEVFLDTVISYEQALVKMVKSNPASGTSHAEELKRVVRKGVLIPCRTVFATMSKCFDFLGFPYQLEEMYATLYQATYGLPKTKVTKIPPDAPTLFNETENIDLDICNTLFCPRCLMYCCLTHDADDLVNPKYMLNFLMEEAKIMCPYPDCIERLETIEESKPKKKKAATSDVHWTPSEIAMCELLTNSHKPCHISSIMITKTCRQIWKFLETNSPNSLKQISSESFRHVKDDRKENDIGEKYVRVRPKESGDIPHYQPCVHADNGACNAKNNCYCVEGATYCERWCCCPLDCPRRFKGCTCKTNCGTPACPCYVAHRECDPRLCRQCGSENTDPNSQRCRNVGIQHNWGKPVEVKISKVVGWGGFIGCEALPGELISEYRGEIISNTECERRALYYDKIQHTYLFTLNQNFVIDATRIGCRVRFINSSKHPNCYARVMMVNGDHRIGIYAKRKIAAGEELFFDYEHVVNKPVKRKRGRKPRKPQKISN